MLGSCRFQLYGEFYSATTSVHKRPHLTHFYMNIQKIGIKVLQRFRKLILSLSITRHTKNLFFFLGFRILIFFRWMFHFPIYISCLLTGHPVIFTSCHHYCPHVVKYWAPIRIILLFGNKKFVQSKLLPSFIDLTHHSKADKIVFIYSFPSISLILIFSIHYELFWTHNPSEKIHKINTTQTIYSPYPQRWKKIWVWLFTADTTQTTCINQ